MKIVFFLLLVGNSRMIQRRGEEMLSIVQYIRHAYWLDAVVLIRLDSCAGVLTIFSGHLG